MMDRELLEQQLSELPLYVYTYIDPKTPVEVIGFENFSVLVKKINQ